MITNESSYLSRNWPEIVFQEQRNRYNWVLVQNFSLLLPSRSWFNFLTFQSLSPLLRQAIASPFSQLKALSKISPALFSNPWLELYSKSWFWQFKSSTWHFAIVFSWSLYSPPESWAEFHLFWGLGVFQFLVQSFVSFGAVAWKCIPHHSLLKAASPSFFKSIQIYQLY